MNRSKTELGQVANTSSSRNMIETQSDLMCRSSDFEESQRSKQYRQTHSNLNLNSANNFDGNCENNKFPPEILMNQQGSNNDNPKHNNVNNMNIGYQILKKYDHLKNYDNSADSEVSDLKIKFQKLMGLKSGFPKTSLMELTGSQQMDDQRRETGMENMNQQTREEIFKKKRVSRLELMKIINLGKYTANDDQITEKSFRNRERRAGKRSGQQTPNFGSRWKHLSKDQGV